MNLQPDIKLLSATLKRGTKRANLRRRTLAQMETALGLAIEASTSDDNWARSSVKPNGFSGTASANEYLAMLREGWKAGIDGVEGLDGLSTDRAEKLSFTRSVGGAFPIVPAFLAGAPDAMLRPYQAPADSVRGLTLVVDSAFSAGVQEHTVLAYAQSVMRLVAWLQAERIDVSVYSVAVLNQASFRNMYVTPIRESDQIMQPERIASILHPSWLRRALFAMIEYEYHTLRLPGSSTCMQGGYGTPSVATADELRQALPTAFSIIQLPQVGRGDPMKAVQESITLKLRAGERS